MAYFNFYCDFSLFKELIRINDSLNINIKKDRQVLNLTSSLLDVLESPNTKICTNDTYNDFDLLAKSFANNNGAEFFLYELLRKYTDLMALDLNVTSDTFSQKQYLRSFNFSNKFNKKPKLSRPIKIKEWIPYYKRTSLTVSKIKDLNSKINFVKWNDINELGHPSTDFVIIDNYICAQRDFTNLFAILKELLSKQNNKIDLNLTLVTMKFYYVNPYLENKKDLKETSIDQVYKRVIDFIKKDLNLNNVNFTLIKIKSGENHDRHIFTNYFTFKAGNSFNFVDKNTGEISLNSLTDFEIIPLTDFTNGEITYAEYYDTHLKSIAEIVKNSENVKGNKINRLLDMH